MNKITQLWRLLYEMSDAFHPTRLCLPSLNVLNFPKPPMQVNEPTIIHLSPVQSEAVVTTYHALSGEASLLSKVCGAALALAGNDLKAKLESNLMAAAGITLAEAAQLREMWNHQLVKQGHISVTDAQLMQIKKVLRFRLTASYRLNPPSPQNDQAAVRIFLHGRSLVRFFLGEHGVSTLRMLLIRPQIEAFTRHLERLLPEERPVPLS